MNEYTPRTDIVRARYHLATIGDDTPDFIIEMGQSRNYAEFDRWLRRVQAEAWEEGYESGAEDQAVCEGHRYRQDLSDPTDDHWKTNPYL